jgi:hypothetical protein
VRAVRHCPKYERQQQEEARRSPADGAAAQREATAVRIPGQSNTIDGRYSGPPTVVNLTRMADGLVGLPSHRLPGS